VRKGPMECEEGMESKAMAKGGASRGQQGGPKQIRERTDEGRG
jgi:hypothetical protein